MIWFEKHLIPPGKWMFLSTVRAGCAEIEHTLESDIDLTEGNETITGCMRAYRQAVMRVLDLVQSGVASWRFGRGTAARSVTLLEESYRPARYDRAHTQHISRRTFNTTARGSGPRATSHGYR